jgi:glycerophosphoryl diester phosphodiesterase
VQPLAVAHRGTPHRHPENTLASFRSALALGCDAIELDVQWTSDEIPIVYHDRTLAHAGGGRKRIHQLTHRELRRLETRYPIPTLEQTLRLLHGKTRLMVELKAREGLTAKVRHLALARAVASMVGQAGDSAQSSILCFDATMLAEVGEAAPQLRRVLNVRPQMPGLAAKLRRASPQVVCADVRSLSRTFGRRVLRNDRQLWSFTCNRPQTVQRALDAGASAIISDRVDWLIQHLTKLGQRAEA